MSTSRQLMTACVAVAIALPSSLPAQDFWSSHGWNEDDLKQRIVSGLIDGFNAPSVPSLRTLPGPARTSLIASATAYTKRFTQSADFRERYAALRDSRKPDMPEAAMTMAQRRAKDKAEIQKAILSMDSSLAQAKGMPEVQAGIRTVIQQLKDQIKAIDDPANPAYGKDAEAIYAQQSTTERAEYARALKEWETRYPASPNPVIKQSLRDFLALAASVDFAAKTQRHPQGGTTFVNPDYEAKPGTWKALFRAGKETTAAMQAAAQQWLTELK